MCEITKKSGIILIVCLLLQYSALSAEFAGGTGEPNDPYQIATAEQLVSIGSDSNLLDKSFILVADIDMDPNLPGGRIFKDALITQDADDSVNGHSGSSFEGIFDGKKHTISNLHIEGKHGHDTGLFGDLSGLVKDLRLTDVNVSGSPCGAIAGLNFRGTILRCQVTGQVSGLEDTGGLVGSNWNGSLMECEAQVQVIGDSDVGGMVGGGPSGTLIRCQVQAEVIGNNEVGGLIGQHSDGSVIECRATGIVTGSNSVGGLIGSCYGTFTWKSSTNCEVTAEQTVGGLIGRADSSGALIMDCYAQGSIAGSIVGGLMGDCYNIRVINSYAACEVVPLEIENGELFIGGLFGDTITRHLDLYTISSFWDIQLSGITVSTGSDRLETGTGLTTEKMLNEDVFRNAGWDFSHTWTISKGDYPKLQWEVKDCNDL